MFSKSLLGYSGSSIFSNGGRITAAQHYRDTRPRGAYSMLVQLCAKSFIPMSHLQYFELLFLNCYSWRNKQSIHMLYDCRDIGWLLEVAFVWIHPIHQNLCRTQWPRVSNNIDSRDSRFVYGYVTLSL